MKSAGAAFIIAFCATRPSFERLSNQHLDAFISKDLLVKYKDKVFSQGNPPPHLCCTRDAQG
jgi:hypothetical protein